MKTAASAAGVLRRAWMACPVLLALLLCQCAATGSGEPPPGVSDVENTWRQAWVYVPEDGDVRRYRMDDEEILSWGVGRWELPLVLYMHGCTGLNSGDEEIMRLAARQGFAVIAPDSFARRSRPMQCDPGTRSGGYNLFVYDFRQAEINYALQRLRTLSWLRAGAKVLFGASEGGVAAARYAGDAFSGRIITHWTCHGGPLVSGLAVPKGEPVLAIVQAADPWYEEGRTRSQRGDCGAFFEGRENAMSLILDDGERHDVFESGRAKTAIADFLRDAGQAP